MDMREQLPMDSREHSGGNAFAAMNEERGTFVRNLALAWHYPT